MTLNLRCNEKIFVLWFRLLNLRKREAVRRYPSLHAEFHISTDDGPGRIHRHILIAKGNEEFSGASVWELWLSWRDWSTSMRVRCAELENCTKQAGRLKTDTNTHAKSFIGNLTWNLSSKGWKTNYLHCTKVDKVISLCYTKGYLGGNGSCLVEFPKVYSNSDTPNKGKCWIYFVKISTEPKDHKPTLYLAPSRFLLQEERMAIIELEYAAK